MRQLNGFGYFILAFKKYAQFSGRSTRSEFWYFHLFNALVSLLFVPLGFVSGVLDGFLFHQTSLFVGLASLLNLIYTAGVFVPSLAVSVRRLHDTNRSGWWFFLAFTIIGIIALIIFYCQKSDPKENCFGEAPDCF